MSKEQTALPNQDDHSKSNTQPQAMSTTMKTTIVSIGNGIVISAKHLFSTSYIVAALILSAGILQPDTHILAFITGIIINAIIAKTLKRLLNHKRPVKHHLHHSDGKVEDVHILLGAGMPSSHAMALFFIATFLSLSLFYRNVNQSPSPTPSLILTTLFSHIFAFSGTLTDYLPRILFLVAIALSMHRVHISVHSFEQVLAGAGLGCIDALIYYYAILPIIFRLFGDRVWVGEGDGSIKSLLLGLSVMSTVTVIAGVLLDRHIYRKVEKRFYSWWNSYFRSPSSSAAQ